MVWSGVNQRGVSFVAADYYTNAPDNTGEPTRFFVTSSHTGPSPDVDALFRAYEQAVAEYGTAADAIEFLSSFYLTQGKKEDPVPFGAPDIVLLADPTQTIFLEYYPGDRAGEAKVLTLSPQQGWFAATNHARLFLQTVDYSRNHSTYLRLARAEAILERQPTPDGIKSVLEDQYYGETELSICRIAAEEGQYFTQASVILSASAAGPCGATYLVNGNPRTKPYQTKEL